MLSQINHRRLLCRLRKTSMLAAAFALSVNSTALSQFGVRDEKPELQARIEARQVTLMNHEAFEDQLRRDLPIGTSKIEVEKYLSRKSIIHSFVKRGSVVDENTFYGIIKNIGNIGLSSASLAIRIQLDYEDTVKRIWFRIDYL